MALMADPKVANARWSEQKGGEDEREKERGRRERKVNREVGMAERGKEPTVGK